MSEKILAYDLGTGGVKASIYDQKGSSLSESFISYETHYPKIGYHEQNPIDWWKAVVSSTRSLLEQNPEIKKDIVCISVSGHSLGVIPLGSEGSETQLLCNQVPIWSDSRAGEQAKRFFENISPEEWYSTTGNGFPASLYSIFKIMWFKDHFPDLYFKTDKFVGTKDYINFRLTGKLFTDFSYASGSGVYDLKGWDYKKEYIDNADILDSKLPDIIPSSEVIGTLLPEVSQELGLSSSVRVVCGGVDNACMALGAGCIGEGMSYTSLGSSAWIAVSGKNPIIDINHKPYVFTHCVPGMFVSSAAIFSAGSSFRWLRDTVCRNFLDEVDPYDAMTALAAQSQIGSNKLIFNPSLAGGSSLDKSPNIKGGFLGLHLGHTQADLIRATLEGVCLNLKIALDVMDSYIDLSEDMLLVGGGAKSQFWRSLFADVYNKNIIQTNIDQEAGSLGAAVLAGVGIGLWEDYDVVTSLHQVKTKIQPARENHEKYAIIQSLFKQISAIQSDIGDMIDQYEW